MIVYESFKKSLVTGLLVQAVLVVAAPSLAHADREPTVVVIGGSGIAAGYGGFYGKRPYGDYGAYLRNRGLYRGEHGTDYYSRYGYAPSREYLVDQPIVIAPVIHPRIVRPYGASPYRYKPYRFQGYRYKGANRY